MSDRSPWRGTTALDPDAEAFDLDAGGAERFHDPDPAWAGVPDAGTGSGTSSRNADSGPARRADRRGRWARWPDAAPAWVRGPGAVVVAVVLAVAVTSALGVRGAAARVEERVAARTALLGLDASMEVDYDGVGEPAGRGAATATVETALTLVNRGDREVRVQLTGVSPPATPDLDDVGEVAVAAQDTAVVEVPLQVDCASLPALDPTSYAELAESTSDWVAVTVTGADGGDGDAGRLPLIGSYGGLSAQLAAVCDPGWWGAVTGEVLEVREDGALRVQVTNEGEEPVQLITSSPLGVDLALDPPLAEGLAGGASAEVVLTARVNCSRPVDLLELPTFVDFSAVGDGWESSVLDQAALVAWIAGRVTAACG